MPCHGSRSSSHSLQCYLDSYHSSVSCWGDAKEAYITVESSLRMGMDVIGTESNVWAFRFACSSAFSPLENEVMNSNGDIGSVTLGIGDRILNGEVPELFYSNGYIVYKIKGKDDLLLLLDPETGIVRDVANGVCGVYCFHNQITDQQIQLAENLTSSDPSVQPVWIRSISNTTASLGIVVGSFGTVVMGEGVAAGSISIGVVAAPVLLVMLPLSVLDNVVRPGAIAEAEQAGKFNTSEYLQNNTLIDIEWDALCQILGSSGLQEGFWDDSDEYAQLAMERNLLDMKETSRAIYAGALALFLPEDHTATLNELYGAYWKAVNLVTVITEDGDKELYNALISQKDWKKLKETLSNNNKIIKINEEWTGDIGTTPKPNDPNSNFLKFFVNKIRSGITKLKTGDIKGGLWDMEVGLSGIEIGVGSVIMYKCIEALGRTEVPRNNTTTSGNTNADYSGGG